MIPANSPAANSPARPSHWQTELARAVSDPAELLELLDLPADLLPAARAAARDFPLRVPRGFVARMRKGDPADPLLRQVLPLGAELEVVPGYGVDPLAEASAGVAPGVLHKYHGRALVVTTGACAVHCRYCFRRHFPYAEANPRRGGWAGTLAALAAVPDLEEVLLSGGDPLSLSDARLAELVAGVVALPGLRRLRLHTRQPVVLPERVDAAFLAWLAAVPLQKVVVIHANHPAEIDATVAGALAGLRTAGATLLNQAVLLRGVNDSTDTLAGLSETLFAHGVLPYYLHLLDRVGGAAHFEVPEPEARSLYAALAARLPGYLLPRLVREVPGASGKTLVLPA